MIPPWTRTGVVGIDTFERLPYGETGLLQHYDLVNRSMVIAVQTDNLGFETENGFEIVGRWKKQRGNMDCEEIKGGHGGRFITQLVEFLLKRSLKKIGNVYRKVTKER